MQSLLIGLAAGLASAVLLASSHRGNMGASLLLFFLTPLPMFLAGLGWRPVAAVIAGLTASGAIAAIFGIGPKLLHFVGQAIAVVVLCQLAQLARPAGENNGAVEPPPAGEGEQAQALEWYPAGRMLAWAALMAGLLALVTVFSVGLGLDEMRKSLREIVETVFVPQLPVFRDKKLSEADLQALTELMLFSLPAGAASVWLASLVVNFYLAGRITFASGRLVRPWPDLGALTFPRGFGYAIAAALAGVLLLDGYPRIVASGFVGALIFCYALLGLAILHYATRDNAARPFILGGVYFGLFLLNTWGFLALALLGALEPIVPLRRWKDRRQTE
jgi:hypothetical protein